jgi:hypothetical protein
MTTPTVHIIRGCSTDPETGGLVVEYLTPTTDVRHNGMVINHALLIPPEDDFVHLIDTVEQTLQRVLTEALASFGQATPMDLPDEMEGPNPFDNPEER